MSDSANPGGASSTALAEQLPSAIAALARGVSWEVQDIGPGGTTAWRLDRDGRDVLLRVAPAGPAGDALAATVPRLAWLAEVVPTAGDDGSASLHIPTVLATAVDPASGDTYLATTIVPGTTADRDEHTGDIEDLLRALAAGLRTVHDLDATSSPFTRTVDDLLADAAARVAAGLVDPARLSPPYQRYSPERLVELAVQARPVGADDPADRVVVQGRPTLANTFVDRGRVAGYGDWSRLTVTDRYLDLAVITRDLAAEISPHALGPFADAYGLDPPDLLKLDFYVLLVELLGSR